MRKCLEVEAIDMKATDILMAQGLGKGDESKCRRFEDHKE